MNKTFTLDSMPDTIGPVKGTHKLTIIEAKEVTASTGSTGIQFTYSIDDGAFKLNYDNCPMVTKDGQIIPFGQAKLKRIIKATGTVVSQFTLPLLCKMLVNKSFLAELVPGGKDNKYLVLGNIDTITEFPTTVQTDSVRRVEPTDITTDEEELSITIPTQEPSSQDW